MSFWSAKLYFIELVDDGKSKRKRFSEESIFVFRAKEYENAFERALEIGKTKEKSYKNSRNYMYVGLSLKS